MVDKDWKYGLNQKVIVNEKARNELPDDVNKTASIHERWMGRHYDYRIKLEDGFIVKVKEEEIDLIGE